MPVDELYRAVFGLFWAWPPLWLCQRFGLRSLPTALAITVWMTPGWWLYRAIFEAMLYR